LHTHHSANVVSAGPSQPRVAPELLISTVLQLISQYGARADIQGDSAMHSAAMIESHLKTLATLPDMEPILRATCQQLSEQWGMLHEREMPKPASATFITRLISGPRPHRTS
jgi:hypothetical protein